MSPPLPVVQAMLICDMVLKEAGTNKQSAIGIFTDVFATRFPMVLNPLALYTCLSDARGEFELSVELVDLDEDTILGRVGKIRFQAADKLASHDFGMRLMNTVFPHAGSYEFRLLADDRYLGSRKLRLRKMEQRPKGPLPPDLGSNLGPS